METQNLEAQKVLVALTASDSLTTTINISNVSAEAIDVDYDTMPGNQPNTYGNFLAIWQNYDTIPWNTEPLKTFPVPTNTPSGSASFTGLNVNNNSYIIGYAVGSILNGSVQKYGNICATAFIPAASSNGDQGTIFTPSISNFNIGSTSVSFQFELPDGITPQTNGAWAAIWKGGNPSYFSTTPLSAIPISPDSSSGRAAFNNVTIGRGITYTVAIFMSGYNAAGGSTQRAVACSASFTN
ncbi:hypothetical protein SAMN05518672_102554 [Chitinophaga sp. CF118]|uniref:hypothetical protein n=1 Tax=Chitinophaga sp. CF118 TaxID=1884367 RepID=UPI0008E355F9|nr:hypothetical protein [Chitinophaga sp. CF118]SFD59869.1 hypothetical protein SAMN05518672_102554 [Chitinophaga sp. CF118]